MKLRPLLSLTGISLLALSTSCHKEEDASPAVGLTRARIVGTETTLDGNFQHARVRWTVDLAPVSLPGWGGRSYQQAKVFGLPNNTDYTTGRTITFQYQPLPLAQETPWRTFGAWKSMAPARTGTDALPEIAVSDVNLLAPQ